MNTINIGKSGKRIPLNESMRQILLSLLIPKFGCVCWYCGIKLGDQEIHIDHIEPISKGGADTIHNLALACLSCNRAKWDLTLQEFFKWIKRIRWLEDFPSKKIGFKGKVVFYDKGDEPELLTSPITQPILSKRYQAHPRRTQKRSSLLTYVSSDKTLPELKEV